MARKQALSVTDAAAQRIQALLANRGKPSIGVRIGVRSRGCSGLSYQFKFDTKERPTDKVFEFDGVKIVVDPKSLPYLEGTELDFAKEGLNEGFKFNNPNVKDECGCGESFNV